jgi:hypothetical protein
MNAATDQTFEERAFAPVGLSAWMPTIYVGLAFVLGLLDHVTLRLVGLMPVDELLLGAVLVQMVLWIAFLRRLPGPIVSPRLLAVFLAAQVLALASYIIADLYRESASGDMVRGWSRMVFLGINILGFAQLFGVSRRCFVALQVGLIFSFVGSLASGPLFGDYWKFAFAYPVTTAVLLVAPRWLGFLGSIVACFALAALQAVMDFRSLGGICAVIGVLLILRFLPASWRRVILLTGAVAGLVLSPIAAQHALSGSGERGTRSNVERSAMLQAAWEGFTRSPIIGQGSWFSRSTVMDDFLLIRMVNAQEAGVGGFDDTDFEGVAIHSQLLVALAEGGLFGAVFFLVYGALILWGLWFCLVGARWTWLIPVQLFILLVAFWNLLMSPFSGPHRVEIALAVGLILLLWRERNQLRAASRIDLPVPLDQPHAC